MVNTTNLFVANSDRTQYKIHDVTLVRIREMDEIFENGKVTKETF